MINDDDNDGDFKRMTVSGDDENEVTSAITHCYDDDDDDDDDDNVDDANLRWRSFFHCRIKPTKCYDPFAVAVFYY